MNDIEGVTYKTIQANTNNFYSSTNKAFHIPNFLYGEPLLKPQRDESHEQMVDRFFRTYPDTFQNISITDFRIEIEHPKDRTITQVHLFQIYQDIPVFGAELILSFNEKHELISYLGKYIPNITVETRSTTKPDEIKQIVVNDLAVDIIQGPKLFIFNRGVLTDQSEQTHLAWRLATNGWVYFIDAHTKEIIYKYEDGDSALNRTVYSGGGGTPTLPGTLVISEGDDTSLVSDADAIAAYNYSEDVYNYFYGNFALDSYNDAGAEMISTVDYATTNLARWCNYLKIQDTTYCPDYQGVLFYAGYSVLDIVAHEWTHAVDDYAVQDTDNELYGLIMADQSGAINESYSDIFGVLIEEEYGSELDWDIGEDSPSGMFRNLADPTTSATPQPDEWSEYDDTQDSHYNSGIPNKAAYLMMREPSDGSEEFNSVYVTGLGLTKAENIFYYTLRDELITSATFDDNYNALMQTCLTLEVITIDDADCESIFDAYSAIGVNTDTSFALAIISASATSGPAPLTIIFDGADSVGINSTISSYVWDFGDSSSDSGGAVSHTYYNPGTYTATLTVIDSNGYTNEASTTITVYASGSITSDTVWLEEHSPYVISGSMSVASGVTLTIKTGVVVKFINTLSSLTVNGTLDAQGTSSDPIVFTSYKDDTYGGDTNGDGSATTPAAGDWRRLSFTASSTVILDHSIVQYGGYEGSGTDYPMINSTAVNLQLTNSTIAESDYYAVHVSSGTATIDENTINDNSGTKGIYASGGTVTISGNIMNSNSGQGIHVYYSSPTISGNTITGANFAIYIEGSSSAPSISGNTLSSYNSAGINSSAGTPMISSNTISDSDDIGIYITGGTPTVSANNLTNSSSYAIYVYSGTATIDSNVIVGGLYGIFLSSSSTFTVTNNTVTGTTYPIQFSGLNSANTITGNSGSDNTYQAIFISGSTDGDYTLSTDSDFAYVIRSMLIVSAGDTLTINPGVVLKFYDTSPYTHFDIAGTLDVLGTVTDPVVFTSIKDDAYGGDTNGDGSATTPAAGDWRYISFDSSSTATLDNTVIRYGGYGAIYMIYTHSDAVAIQNSMITNGASNNIVISSASPTLTSNTISGASSDGIYVTSGSPEITGNTITNSRDGIVLASSSTATVADNRILGNSMYGVNMNNAGGTVKGNIISNNGYGIYLAGSSANPTIVGNVITNNTYGISAANNPTATVTDNFIFDNSSYGFYNTSSITALAESNWWGDASGPYHATSNPTGTGDTVSSNVDFTPWLTTTASVDLTPPAEVRPRRPIQDVLAPSLLLRWVNPTAADFAHVQIDRSDGFTTTILTTTATGTSYLDTTMNYNTLYTYTLYAIDTSGNVSNGVSFTAP